MERQTICDPVYAPFCFYGHPLWGRGCQLLRRLSIPRNAAHVCRGQFGDQASPWLPPVRYRVHFSSFAAVRQRADVAMHLNRKRDAYTNTVETERMREILRKELKVRSHDYLVFGSH